MAADSGRHQNRVYRGQDGSIYNRDGNCMEILSGTVSPSSSGKATITFTNVSGFRSVTASIKSTSVSTAAGVADDVQVGFATNSSSIELLFTRNTSSAVAERIAATSTANIASYLAIPN